MRRALLTLTFALAACQATGQPTPSSPAGAQPSPTAEATPGPLPPSVAATPHVTPIPGCLPACVFGELTEPGPLPAGDYTTENFFGGQLTVTMPGGWSSFEDSTGEFGLQPPGTGAGALIFWIDIYPIIDPTSDPVPGVERTVEGVLQWVRENPNLEVLDEAPATLGGLSGVALDLGRADEAVNVENERRRGRRLARHGRHIGGSSSRACGTQSQGCTDKQCSSLFNTKHRNLLSTPNA